MKGIEIYVSSVVAQIAAATQCEKLSDLSRLAKKETVELQFRNDKCRITARHIRTIKVPKKAMESSDGLLSWMRERIDAAWK